ncbi:dNTP triphosphohydrolase [candidate division KSB1 bacterium]|nr:dNTP triphosphohydrolase [candidate division KSB1 bacterium]
MNYSLHDRKNLEALEETTLAPYAYKSAGVHKTRRFAEAEHSYRTAFQRDRDRIIHSRAFRRLKHKRQVFLTSESDHYRTRITHTLEVSQLSRTMARALGVNEDLTEAIALGHDIGHTPFGHLGEFVLNEIMSGRRKLQVQKNPLYLGGFKHNYQSLRVVDSLEKKYQFNGLNLTAPVREGILKHTRLKRKQVNYPDFYLSGLHYDQDVSTHLEGQIVAICDEIAQRTHDLEDGIRAGLVDLRKVKEMRIVQIVDRKLNLSALSSQDQMLYLGLLISGLINHLVDDVIRNTLKNTEDFSENKNHLKFFDEELVRFSPEMDPLQKDLNKFIYKEIIDFSRIQWSDELGEKLLFRLFEAYFTNPELLPEYVLERYLLSIEATAERLDRDLVLEMQQDGDFFRLICDHIAGMTDNFALREAMRLSKLQKFEARDLDLETALGNSPLGEQWFENSD